jgi:hypothetical protein
MKLQTSQISQPADGTTDNLSINPSTKLLTKKLFLDNGDGSKFFVAYAATRSPQTSLQG